jgi:hypothetical protein
VDTTEEVMDDFGTKPVTGAALPLRWWTPRAARVAASVGGGLGLLFGVLLGNLVILLGEGPAGTWREDLQLLIFVLITMAVGAASAAGFAALITFPLDVLRLMGHRRSAPLSRMGSPAELMR